MFVGAIGRFDLLEVLAQAVMEVFVKTNCWLFKKPNANKKKATYSNFLVYVSSGVSQYNHSKSYKPKANQKVDENAIYHTPNYILLKAFVAFHDVLRYIIVVVVEYLHYRDVIILIPFGV